MFGIDDAAAAAIISGVVATAGAVGSSAISSSSSSGYDKESALFDSVLQYNYNSALANQQFERNKWFAQHQHQNEVSDLRKAGLNPILSANNGASGSVGLGSVGMADSAGSSSALSNVRLQKAQLAMTAAQTISDVLQKRANSSLASEQAKTESVKRDNIVQDTVLKNLDSQLKEIEKANLPKSYELQFKRQIAETKKVLNDINVNNIIAKSNQVNSAASMLNAQTNKFLSPYLKNKYVSESANNIFKSENIWDDLDPINWIRTGSRAQYYNKHK